VISVESDIPIREYIEFSNFNSIKKNFKSQFRYPISICDSISNRKLPKSDTRYIQLPNVVSKYYYIRNLKPLSKFLSNNTSPPGTSSSSAQFSGRHDYTIGGSCTIGSPKSRTLPRI
jgi:hypothetical protein